MSAQPAYVEYFYSNAAANPSHSYLGPAMSKLLRDVGDHAAILDLGCGNGALTSLAASRQRRVVGVDLSVTGIAAARRYYPNIQFLQADVCADCLPDQLSSGNFDVVMSFEVIEHVYAPRQLLKNCLRALKPGGWLIVSTPYHGYLKNLSLAVAGKLDNHFTALWDGGHIKFWSRRTLSLLLQEVGFKVVQFEGSGRWPLLWKSMLLKAQKVAACGDHERQGVRFIRSK